MLTMIRCDGADPTFAALTQALDRDLRKLYGEQMDFYGAFNLSNDVEHALYAELDGEPVGCGCFKPFSEGTVEMKRVFVHSSQRGKGIARELMRTLEIWARELGYRTAVLETGVLQPEAIRLYEAAGYERIPNYPPYEGVAESICYQKAL